MGITSGIVVLKQITDEYKWFQAMERIQNKFEGEAYFKILPKLNTEAFTVEVFDELMLAEDNNFYTNGSTSIDWDWNQADGMPRNAYSIRPPTLFQFSVCLTNPSPVFIRVPKSPIWHSIARLITPLSLYTFSCYILCITK